MTDEIVKIFGLAPDGMLIDATFGLGGHSKAIHGSLSDRFRIIGIDCDAEILRQSAGNLPDGITIRKMRFSEIPSMIEKEGLGPVSGALYDLGLNSAQLDDPSRGFSFSSAGPIDMRFDRASGQSARDLIDKMGEKEIGQVLKEFGEERHWRAIARAVAKARPTTTDALASLIKGIVGPRHFIKSAARVFQALRIYVNRELDELRTALSGIAPLMAVGGRVAVISYHSLEDGIVKRQFLLDSGRCLCDPDIPVCVCGKRTLLKVITKKPLRPSDRETMRNPRARAARLRYAERI